jgi:flagellin-specific chaperone FliS
VILPAEYVQRAAAQPIDRSRFLLLVLEGGHALLVRARAALALGDPHGFGADLRRAQEVMLEVAQSLDGAIAADLGRLADFVVGRLALANAEGSLAHLDEVLRAYDPILDAYRAIVRDACASG